MCGSLVVDRRRASMYQQSVSIRCLDVSHARPSADCRSSSSRDGLLAERRLRSPVSTIVVAP